MAPCRLLPQTVNISKGEHLVLNANGGVAGRFSNVKDGAFLKTTGVTYVFVCRAFNGFCAKGGFANGPAGALLTFESDSPAYSYLQYGADGNVCHTVEKQVVSQ